MPSHLLREVGTGLTGVSSDLTWLLTAAELTQPWLMGSVSASLHIEGKGMAEARGGPHDHCPHAWLIHDGVARKQGRGVDRARPSRRLGWDGGGVHGGPACTEPVFTLTAARGRTAGPTGKQAET